MMFDVCETVLIFVLICQELELDPKTPPENILPLVNASTWHQYVVGGIYPSEKYES